MTIPKYDEIQYPLLEYLHDRDTVKYRDFEEPMAQHFNLSPDEVAEEYESGNGKIFFDRISWALTYLNIARLIERPKRAHYRITQDGLDVLGDHQRFQELLQTRYAEHEAAKRAAKEERAAHPTNYDKVPDAEADQTPQEALLASANELKENVYNEILSTILSKTPQAFEKLVTQLLHTMGYGGGIRGAAMVTSYVNDGGIDGIIREDILGLGWVHIQAKRYAPENTIGREDIQKFVGALAVAQSNKGVFITTSRFSKGAREYAETLNGTTNVALIDGQQLAEFIYEHGLGMQVEQTIVIKRLDGDFWDRMQDNPSA